jgi:IclR family transcriptional regulator, pca regulon regulatory protein
MASDPDFMLSLARGLAVIRAFGEGKPQLSIREIALATGFSRAAARRCLHTLITLGYASGHDGVYELTPATLSLASNYLGSTSIARVAQPILERVSQQLHEASSVAVLDGDDIVYVARVPTSRIMTVTISVGTRFPAYATSMGRVMLAGLPAQDLEAYLAKVRLERLTARTVTTVAALLAEINRARSQGWALVDQELEEGLRSVAAPIRDRTGRTVAALNISAAASRNSIESIRRALVPPLVAAAARIEADLPAGRF